VDTLTDEVEFLVSIVDDGVLSTVATDLLPLLAEARSIGTLVIEGP
jgi:hypothetical protein